DLAETLQGVIRRDDEQALILASLLEEADDERIFNLLQNIILEENYSDTLRHTALSSLGATWTGSGRLMRMAETGSLPVRFDSLAKAILTSVWRPDILARARAFYNI